MPFNGGSPSQKSFVQKSVQSPKTNSGGGDSKETLLAHPWPPASPREAPLTLVGWVCCCQGTVKH